MGYYCIRWTSVLTLLYQYDLVTYHAISAGLSHTDAGLLASIFSLTSIPFSMTIPSLTTRLSNRHRQIMLTVISIAGLLGIAMLLYPSKSFLYWLVAHLLIGTACSALSLISWFASPSKPALLKRQPNCLVLPRQVVTS